MSLTDDSEEPDERTPQYYSRFIFPVLFNYSVWMSPSGDSGTPQNLADSSRNLKGKMTKHSGDDFRDLANKD